MARAVAAARRGLGSTYPNPCVGAVLVRRETVIATGRSDRTGGPHAEVRALAKAGDAARGSTLYVTLEPCAHHGRTGPCTEAIIAAGVARVVIGVRDPATAVKGRGVRRLRRAGIQVVEGVGRDACALVHEHYLHHAVTGLPFVTLKTAASLDARLAVRTGHSRWITGEPARRFAHRLRAHHHGIAVGVGTVLADNPQLNVRLVSGVDPVRVVFDSRLRLATARPRPGLVGEGTLVLHTGAASKTARDAIVRLGAEAVRVKADRVGRVDVTAALRHLGGRPIRSLLIEGGGALIGAFVAARRWQRWHWMSAPKILGEGTAAVRDVGWDTVGAAPDVRIESCRRVGDDLHLVALPADRDK